MRNRSQSDVIGVVVLTLIVTVTVTASGGIALTEWQSDIGGEPLANIESTMSDDTLTLEHTGGSELNASNVVVRIDNGDATYSLAEFEDVDDTFTGGMRIEKNDLETRAGGVQLRVIHEPSGTVLHDRLHDLGFRFLIGGKSGSVFMIPNKPVGYTAPTDASVTVDNDSVLTVDEPNTNVTGLTTGGSTTVSANDYTNVKTVDVSVIDRDQLNVSTHSLTATDAETFEVEGELTDLGTLDEADLYFRYRKQQPVEFNGEPTNNSDAVISGAKYHTNPDGYGINSSYLHDNTPLVPGMNRTYEFVVGDHPYNELHVAFRDRVWTEAGTFVGGEDAIDVPHYDNRFEIKDELPENRPFDLRIEYSDDGSTVRMYFNGTEVESYDGFDEHHELYLSATQYDDYADEWIDPEDRVRAVSVPGFSDPQLELIKPGAEAPTNYSGAILGATPGEKYFIDAYAEQEISNAVLDDSGKLFAAQTEELVRTETATNVTAESARLSGDLINSLGDTDLSFVVIRTDNGSVVAEKTVATDVDTPQPFSATVPGLQPETNYTYYARAEDTASTGERVAQTGENATFTTDEPSVETLDATVTGGDSANVTGRLTDLGGLDRMGLYVRYWKQQPIEFNGDPTDNGDDVISDGKYYNTSPEGYSFGEHGYLHDNTPLVPGTNRTYEFASKSRSNSLYLTFRDREWTEVGTFDPYQDSIETSDYDNMFEIKDRPLEADRFEVRVEYTADGSTVRMYTNDTQVKSYSGFDEHHRLYVSGFLEIADFISPEDRLRATSVPGLGAPQSEFVTTIDTAPTNYTGVITDLDPDSLYFVTAYGRETINGTQITAKGVPMAAHTESIVETGGQTNVTSERARLHGELTDSLGDTDLSFVVTRTDTGTVVAEETAETGVDTAQSFNATVTGLSPETNYTYYVRAEDTDSTGQPVNDTGANVSFTTDTPVVRTLDTESTGSSTINVTGRLVDLGGLDQTGLYVRYWKQQPVEFNGEPTNNSDAVISGAKYHTNPDGYGINSSYLHDNTPLVPGMNRTYEFVVGDHPYNELHVAFRDRVWTEAGTFVGGEDAIDVPRYDNRFEIKDELPENRPFDLRIEYSDDGSTVRMYFNGTEVESYDGFDEHHELYLSATQYDDYADEWIDPEDRVRAVSVPGFSDPRSERVTTTDTAPTNYSTELTGLDPDSVYFAEAYSSVEVDDQYINATGGKLANRTDTP